METTQTEPEKFVVNDSELEYITTKLEKLNRKATKLGLAPMVLTVLRNFEEEKENSDHSITVIKKAEITITGEPPKIAGWTFIATVEPVEDSEEVRNMINKLPGVTVDVPVEYRTASMFRCDHCHTERQRNEIFVIQHENGEFKVVGRTCIKDFMGYHANPAGLVRMAQNWQDFIDEVREGLGGGGGYVEHRVNLREFLFRAAYFVNMYGYRNTSYEDAYGMPFPPTKHAAFNSFDEYGKAAEYNEYLGFFYNYDGTTPAGFGRGFRGKSVKTMTREEYESARNLSDAAREHMCTLVDGDEDALNDYLYNMKTIMMMKYIASKHSGYAASVIQVYLKYLGREQEREEARKSEWVGKPGDKIEFVGKLINVRGFTSQWGDGRILVFGDANGNRYKWFTNKPNENQIGELVRVKATIKKHDEFREEKSTVITRAKISTVEVA